MSDNKAKTGVSDRRQVSMSDEYEIQHFAKETGITLDQVRELIGKHGNDREKLTAEAVKLERR